MGSQLFSHNFPLKMKWDFKKWFFMQGNGQLKMKDLLSVSKMIKMQNIYFRGKRPLAIFATVSLGGNYNKVICIICIFYTDNRAE